MIRRYFLLPVFALTSFAGARDVCRRQQLKLVCDQQKSPHDERSDDGPRHPADFMHFRLLERGYVWFCHKRAFPPLLTIRSCTLPSNFPQEMFFAERWGYRRPPPSAA